MERKFICAALICAITSFYGAAGEPSLEVLPRLAVVRVGQNVSLLCRSGKPLQYCRIEQLSPKRTSWNLKPGSRPTADGVVYYGSGLQSGQCGFTIERVQAANNGEYRCTMGFQEGSEESIGTMNLTVAVPPSTPELIVAPSMDRSGDFKDGDVISASCSIQDGRPVSNLTWYIGDEMITRDMSMPLVTHVVNEDLYAIQQNLTYPVTWRDHGKTLRCVAQHLALEDRNNQSIFQINVRFAPRARSDPEEKFGLIVGEPADVTVTVNANPKPRISWTINTEELLEGQTDTNGHLTAIAPTNEGSGAWKAVLRISSVTMEDITSNYVLKARNDLGEESYRIMLSTSDEPQVLQLGAGAIIGIVVAIMVLLLAIFLLIFARATGRWCFAGGVSTRQDHKESSDTESADHGPTQRSKKPKNKFTNIFKKKSDKVGDDTEMAKPTTMEDDKDLERPVVQQQIEQQQLQQQPPKQGDSIVYAELDLKDLKGVRRPQVRAEDDKTEYAEIVYTTKPEEERGAQ